MSEELFARRSYLDLRGYGHSHGMAIKITKQKLNRRNGDY